MVGKMKLLQRNNINNNKALLIILVTTLTGSVDLVASDPVSVACTFPDDNICQALCGGSGMGQCVKDEEFDGDDKGAQTDAAPVSRGTCICGSSIGGEADVTYGASTTYTYECIEAGGAKCRPCPDKSSILYSCTLSVAPVDFDDKPVEIPNDFCGCANAGATVNGKSAAEQKGQGRGRRRGRFPPILSKLLQALEYVKKKYSRGRQ